jgi:hypothetical protein
VAITVLERSLAHAIEDYNLLMAGNESMLAERNELCYRTEDLESGLEKVRVDAAENIAALEAKLKSAEVHSVDVAADGEKRLKGFERELVNGLEKLHALYVHNVQSIGGLCSPMAEGEPSATDYLRWLSIELTSLLQMFADVNENFISTAVEGTLVMARSSIDLGALQTVVVDSGADILLTEKDV